VKLFSSLELHSNQSAFKELEVGLYNDYSNVIRVFEPESIMAEHINENAAVLAQAVKNWSGYGLFYPDIKNIDLELLSLRFPKIILLREEDLSIKTFENFGRVVFDLIEYKKAVCKLIYEGSFIFDE